MSNCTYLKTLICTKLIEKQLPQGISMPIIKLKFLYIPVWSMQESQKARDV